ncbi:MAG: glycosyltransferase [Catenulispora sp.]|nr:glycosyltransferase [Catenulispora sp.]
MPETAPLKKTRLAIVSTYPPRHCGIATFSRDLTSALAQAAPDIDVEVCAMDRDGLPYPAEVTEVIDQDSYADHRRAAASLADSGVDVVVIEHEYGIFGGADGAWITGFAAELTARGVPYAVTLHTVLSEPTWSQAGTLHRLCRDAAAVTVFTEVGRTLAVRTGIAPADRIVHVPHGAPTQAQAPLPSPADDLATDASLGSEVGPQVRQTLDEVAGRRLLSTFGLISPGKGLETAIEALGQIAGEHPDVSYLIAGSTHPEIVRRSGEIYRESLVQLATRLGLSDRVVFLDSYLTGTEISAILARTEIFCTPYRSREQISSGALTFAIAAGCPVVSTSYHYAEDMLRDGAGITVPPGDAAAFADGLRAFLGDPARLASARRAAQARGATLHWSAVARRSASVFRACAAQGRKPVPSWVKHLPPLRFTHLERLTDHGGIVQFATGTQPDPESGYCVDDVARLAIVAAGFDGQHSAAGSPQAWIDMSLDFLLAAFDPETQSARNMRSIEGSWLDDPHPGDHVGRLIWALGEIAAAPGVPDKYRARAVEQLETARTAVTAEHEISLRTAAYAVLGLVQLPEPTPELDICLERVNSAFETNASEAWPWFEDVLTYDNARLAQALISGGTRIGDTAMVRRGLTALDWYLEQVGLGTADGHLTLIGNRWRRKDQPRSEYEGDEQPLDAAAVVEACTQAWRVTGDPRYSDRARRAFAWFLGANRLRIPLYDAGSGGGRDGLRAEDANQNEGAESTLAYYQARGALTRSGLAD